MTVASPSCRNNYIGNGSATQYSYSYSIVASSDLLVLQLDISGNLTTLILGVNYTVDGVGSPTGGNVYLIDSNGNPLALPSGYTLAIIRRRPLTQQTSLRNQGEFYAAVHEDSFDNACMVDQQLQDQINGCLQLPPAISPSTFSPVLPPAIVTPGAFLIVNPAGNGLTVATTGPSVLFTNSFGASYASLKAAAALAPASVFCAFATDTRTFVGYCGNPAIGDGGFIALGGG